MKKIFLTGATGLLGPSMLAELLRGTDNEVHVLIRRFQNKTATDRLKEVLELIKCETIIQKLGLKIHVHEGDVTLEKLGLNKNDYQNLLESIDEVFHCAANTNFALPLDYMRLQNVNGTANILKFVIDAISKRKKIRAHHVSTTYVAGNQNQPVVFRENDLSINQKFNNTYEQSKYEAELLVHEARQNGLEVNVYRTSIIVGDSISGIATNLKTIYQLLQIFSTEFFDEIPARKNSPINVVPCNEAAKAIFLISQDTTRINQTYHITNPHDFQFDLFANFSCEFFGYKKPSLIPIEHYDFSKLSTAQRKIIEPFAPYMNNRILFDSANSSEILSKTGFQFSIIDQSFLKKIFEYCLGRGFEKKVSLD